MLLYVVYSYTCCVQSDKFIVGIYKELKDAINRQYVVCGENSIEGVNSSIRGNGKITIINVVPEGDCNIELFTTFP